MWLNQECRVECGGMCVLWMRWPARANERTSESEGIPREGHRRAALLARAKVVCRLLCVYLCVLDLRVTRKTAPLVCMDGAEISMRRSWTGGERRGDRRVQLTIVFDERTNGWTETSDDNFRARSIGKREWAGGQRMRDRKKQLYLEYACAATYI